MRECSVTTLPVGICRFSLSRLTYQSVTFRTEGEINMKTLLPLLMLPLTCVAGEIQPYHAKEIQPYQANEIQPTQAREIQPYQAKEIQPTQAREIQPYQAKEIQPYQSNEIQLYRSNSLPHLFTKEEREQMHQNDVKAGRTHESMSKRAANGQRAKGSYNPDPYNTGGWNYNTNQPASPIWNPNRQ